MLLVRCFLGVVALCGIIGSVLAFVEDGSAAAKESVFISIGIVGAVTSLELYSLHFQGDFFWVAMVCFAMYSYGFRVRLRRRTTDQTRRYTAR